MTQAPAIPASKVLICCEFPRSNEGTLTDIMDFIQYGTLGKLFLLSTHKSDGVKVVAKLRLSANTNHAKHLSENINRKLLYFEVFSISGVRPLPKFLLSKSRAFNVCLPNEEDVQHLPEKDGCRFIQLM